MDCCEAAAKWWADQARKPLGLEKIQVTDREDPIGGIFMAMGINALSNRGSDSPDVINQFEKVLARKIKEEAEKGKDVYISTDYGPEYFLAKAMNEAGMRKTIFPMKTNMVVSNGTVKVKLGYGREYKKIYPVETEK